MSFPAEQTEQIDAMKTAIDSVFIRHLGQSTSSAEAYEVIEALEKEGFALVEGTDLQVLTSDSLELVDIQPKMHTQLNINLDLGQVILGNPSTLRRLEDALQTIKNFDS